MSSVPTLYLGLAAVVTDTSFNFGDQHVVAPTPIDSLDVANKLYVDQLVQSQSDRIDSMLAGSGVDLNQLKEISDYAAALNAAEQSNLESAVVSLSSTISTLQTFVDTTKADLMASDVAILVAVASETTSRTLQDASLQASITSTTQNVASYVASNNSRSTTI